MKSGLTLVLFFALAPPAFSASFNANPTADAFVAMGAGGNLAGNNYGGAGSLSLAAPGSAQGELQSVLQFNLSGAIDSFNSTFGVGQWNIHGNVSGVFNSRNFGTAANRPELTIVAVPEPGPLVLGVLGVLLWGGWQMIRPRK